MKQVGVGAVTPFGSMWAGKKCRNILSSWQGVFHGCLRGTRCWTDSAASGWGSGEGNSYKVGAWMVVHPDLFRLLVLLSLPSLPSQDITRARPGHQSPSSGASPGLCPAGCCVTAVPKPYPTANILPGDQTVHLHSLVTGRARWKVGGVREQGTCRNHVVMVTQLCLAVSPWS